MLHTPIHAWAQIHCQIRPGSPCHPASTFRIKNGPSCQDQRGGHSSGMIPNSPIPRSQSSPLPELVPAWAPAELLTLIQAGPGRDGDGTGSEAETSQGSCPKLIPFIELKVQFWLSCECLLVCIVSVMNGIWSAFLGNAQHSNKYKTFTIQIPK